MYHVLTLAPPVSDIMYILPCLIPAFLSPFHPHVPMMHSPTEDAIIVGPVNHCRSLWAPFSHSTFQIFIQNNTAIYHYIKMAPTRKQNFMSRIFFLVLFNAKSRWAGERSYKYKLDIFKIGRSTCCLYIYMFAID